MPGAVALVGAFLEQELAARGGYAEKELALRGFEDALLHLASDAQIFFASAEWALQPQLVSETLRRCRRLELLLVPFAGLDWPIGDLGRRLSLQYLRNNDRALLVGCSRRSSAPSFVYVPHLI